MPRDVALELWTAGSAWFSSEQGKKGRIEKDQLADPVVLSKDYFNVAEEEIKGIESVMTIVDGKVVYAAGHFTRWHPAIPIVPDWSPVVKVPGHYRSAPPAAAKLAQWCRCISAVVAVAYTVISMILRVNQAFRCQMTGLSGRRAWLFLLRVLIVVWISVLSLVI